MKNLKYIKINKKKYYFNQIKWFDILGDTGHSTYQEFKEMQPVVMITNAYIFSQDNFVIKTFSSYAEYEECFSDRNVIPRGCVISVKKIQI
jgi:hypothetical protein